MKSTLLLLLTGCVLFFPVRSSCQKAGGDRYKIKTVVIDPGHGGKDPGALGYSTAREKDVVLKVGLKLGQYIQEVFPDVRVIYTRQKDEFVELHERARIANEAKADLFISIHCNASPSPAAYGTEIYVLGLHRTEDNLAVAKRENSVIMMEDNYMDHYEGFDPSSPEGYIIFSMFQDVNLKQSIEFASLVDEQFGERVHRKSRGVHQAGFMVLYKTTMPSILIELGFLTNKNEEAFLASEDGITYMASAIFRAFKQYKQNYEAVISDEGIAKSKPAETTSVVPVVQTYENEPIIFKVQFLVSKSRMEQLDGRYRVIRDFEIEPMGPNAYRYLTGNFSDYKEAAMYLGELRDKGIKDAFVVAYKGAKRISIQEAIVQQ
ncbi:MAG: N-acetylmuramoyl-L-alanine amidase [Chitinophagales bacterium]|nr:MAG: N-acetylmuramoyl-L-alanine amidase [Chitinophagales bacterium]